MSNIVKFSWEDGRNLDEYFPLEAMQEDFEEKNGEGADLLTYLETSTGYSKEEALKIYQQLFGLKYSFDVNSAKLYSEMKECKRILKEAEEKGIPLSDLEKGNAQAMIAQRNEHIAVTSLGLNQGGEVELNINLGLDLPIGFVVKDGNIVFDGANLTPEKLQAVLYHLDMAGLLDKLVIPPSAAKDFKTSFGKVLAEYKEEKESLTLDTRGRSDAIDNSEPDIKASSISGGLISLSGMNHSVNQAHHKKQNWIQRKFTKSKEQKEEKEINKIKVGAIDAHINSWAKGNHEKKGRTFFRGGKGGYKVYWFFPTDNKNNMSERVTKDKDGNVKHNYSFGVGYNKKGDVIYYLPPGKKMESFQAELLVELQVKAGNTHIKFEDLAYPNMNAVRDACGLHLIVPIGVKVGPKHVASMMKTAMDEHGESSEKVIEYGKMLVQQMRENIESKGVEMTPTEEKIYREFMNKTPIEVGDLQDYRMKDFQQRVDDRQGVTGLLREVEENHRTTDASDAIANATAFAAFYNGYKHSLYDKDKNEQNVDKFVNYIANKHPEVAETVKKLSVDKSVPISKMSVKDSKAIFQAILPAHKKDAQKALVKAMIEKTLNQNNKMVVETEIKKAQADMMYVPRDWKKMSKYADANIYLPDYTNKNFNFKEEEIEAAAEIAKAKGNTKSKNNQESQVSSNKDIDFNFLDGGR